MPAPVIVVVDGDAHQLGDTERELRDRYARDYRVMCIESPHSACSELERLATDGEPVALILAGQWLSGMTGSDLLDEARRLHPHAKRSLLVRWGEWGDRATGDAIFDAIASGRIDHYVLKPSSPPDELFHHAISGLLLEWAEARSVSPYTIHVVGESWSGRAFELREALGRCAMPYSFCLADSPEGRTLLAQVGETGSLPMIVFPDGRVLSDPSNMDIARAAGSPVSLERAEFDLVIVGAGPAGLSAAVYGASEGLTTLVVDEGGLGGQATSSSQIRNYLGFPGGVSGRRLAQQAYQQAWVFGAKFVFMHRVTDIRGENDELAVTLSDAASVRARAVIVATGASYRRLGIPALEALNGAGVSYGSPASEAVAMTGRDVYVVGGANSAGQAALYLARYARQATLLVRAESLAAGMSDYLVSQVEATANLEVRLGAEVVGGGGNGRLDHLVLRDRAGGREETVPADGLFLMIGARPHTEWLPPAIERDEQGFVLTGPDLPNGQGRRGDRAPLVLETSMPAVFAAGDVRHGSVKRVASAVGEGSVAIQLLHRLFAAEGLHRLGRAEQAAVAAAD